MGWKVGAVDDAGMDGGEGAIPLGREENKEKNEIGTGKEGGRGLGGWGSETFNSAKRWDKWDICRDIATARARRENKNITRGR